MQEIFASRQLGLCAWMGNCRKWGLEFLLSDALSDSAIAFCVSYGFFSRMRFITSLTMGST